MANFNQIGLDLQSVMKRTYANLLYRSTFYNFLNEFYIGSVRQTGTPIIEVIKQKKTTITTRDYVEMTSAKTPELVQYVPVKVDLTELKMDYSFRLPVAVLGSNIEGAIDEALRLNDSEMAVKIDTYGFGKLNSAITGDRTASKTAYDTGSTYTWNPANKEAYITALNALKAMLFNLNVYDTYRLGLEATEYGNLVSALTSVLHFETLAGVEGVDRGVVAQAYGIDIFPVASAVLTHSEKGYFGSPVATVGDTFFSGMSEYLPGSYAGWPGYYVCEGNVLFGASVVRPEALVKLVASASV